MHVWQPAGLSDIFRIVVAGTDFPDFDGSLIDAKSIALKHAKSIHRKTVRKHTARLRQSKKLLDPVMLQISCAVSRPAQMDAITQASIWSVSVTLMNIEDHIKQARSVDKAVDILCKLRNEVAYFAKHWQSQR